MARAAPEIKIGNHLVQSKPMIFNLTPHFFFFDNGVGHDPPAQAFRAVGVYGRGWTSLFKVQTLGLLQHCQVRQ